MKTINTDIVILGAGIGGYETFRCLNKQLKRAGINKKILLVDQNNYFTFTPLLHEVAFSSVKPQHATISIRELLYKTSHDFLKAKVLKVFPKKKLVKTDKNIISYDYCIVALGSKVNHFNIPGAQQFSHSVRTAKEALLLKKELINKLEDTRYKNIDINIIGGGYTGVEVATQILNLEKNEGSKLYPEKKINLSIIEAGDRLTKQLPKKAQDIIEKTLKKGNVKLLLNTRVTSVSEKLITFDKTSIDTDITIWTAGCKNVADNFLLPEWTENSKIPVSKNLFHKKAKSLYAVGDIILFKDNKTGLIAPQLGEAAHQEGQYVAKHIVRTMQKKKTPPFKFTSHGMLIPVGDWYGIFILGNFVFAGRFAWWLRRTAYLLFLPGIIRKIQIATDWTLHTVGFKSIIDTED